ncbi:ADP-ribosyl-(dinitrogen reductase) hydrolase [Noviherbaspirillum sp.]|uniref:ADP-ribosyl-(dinitrogen reductase) hydrolase n=1 Tax=Noviherbaspirillum sp. TaxID=1926288 RepID=UPI002B49DE04|nr:ADP-ribosyl-(dinitrogen reductase) hydrolase [Noviherbaspirillum sp.]HJV82289.1 ADP-ribosyl-(dinitrogen reductase) hydrolase [Noviherbaspirillum sp.]
MRTIIVTTRIDEKLDSKHAVTVEEVDQCFDNKCGVNLIDDREDNRTDPPTFWFIAETNRGRLLKIVYVYRDGKIFLKTAYEPNETEIAIYETEGK